MEDTLSKYDRNIDFLRFLFCIIIIIFHMYHNNLSSVYGQLDIYQQVANSTARSWVIVELFFIIAGYYLYNTPFQKTSFKDFIFKKIVRLWPLFAVATLLETRGHFSFDTIMRLLFFQGNGLSLQYKGINWFVSSLFWSFVFYFSLIKTIEKKYLLFIISLVVYFSYVYLINYGFGREVRGGCSIAMVRGIAGIGLGYLFHDVCRRIDGDMLKKFKSKINKIIFALLEIGLLIFLIFAFLCNIHFENNFIFVIAFLPLMFSFVFRLGILSQFLEKDFSSVLGKYSYSCYVMQQFSFYVAIFILQKIKANFYFGSILTLIISLFIGVAAHEIIGRILKKKSTTIEEF